NVEIPSELPIIPLRNTVLFPGVVMPITVGREKSIKLIRDANIGNKLIGCVAQKDFEIEEPEFSDFYTIGCLAKILKVIEMPDSTITVIIQGQKRFEIIDFVTSEPYYIAKVRGINELRPYEQDREYMALVTSLKDTALQIIKLNQNIPHEVSFALRNIRNSSFLINFIGSNSDIELNEKQDLLEIDDIKERATKLLEILSKQVEMLQLKVEIQNKTKQEISQQQKEYLLHQQMRTIQNELGENPMEQELENLRKEAAKKQWSETVAKHFDKEANKLKFLNPSTGEYSVQLNYLQTLLDIPWSEKTDDQFDMKQASEVLDADHYGLEKVKDRILEHLAVLKLKNDMKSPIICLVGPPGVGKTSLGRSIAKALGRKYIRMSLGGLHDEAEIRGHRKTYIGAMPGRIIQNMRKVKTINPVF
ncbi:MAG: endopeptidase La, partial [Bacteroidia bacterium]